METLKSPIHKNIPFVFSDIQYMQMVDITRKNDNMRQAIKGTYTWQWL